MVQTEYEVNEAGLDGLNRCATECFLPCFAAAGGLAKDASSETDGEAVVSGRSARG